MFTNLYCDRCGKMTTSSNEIMVHDGKVWKCAPTCGTVFITRKLAMEEALKYPIAKVGRIILDNSGYIPLTYIVSQDDNQS